MRTLPFILLALTAAALGRDISTLAAAPPPEAARSFPEPGKAWENSLAMKFVPVPGTQVLFSIWDTRVRDYMAFLADKKTKVEGAATLPVGIPAGSIIDEARRLSESGITGLKLPPRSLPDEIKAEAAQSQNARHPLYPIAQVTWEDASDFCGWLTEKEQREGKLDKNQGYRLPTDQEWSQAVGLPEESGSTPKEKSGRIKDVYPWGREWPPPRRSVYLARRPLAPEP